MDFRQIVASNIVRVRREKGLSQEGLAWEAGVNRSYMAKIETAKTWIGLEILVKLAAVLEIEPMELLRPLPPPKRGRKPQSQAS